MVEPKGSLKGKKQTDWREKSYVKAIKEAMSSPEGKIHKSKILDRCLEVDDVVELSREISNLEPTARAFYYVMEAAVRRLPIGTMQEVKEEAMRNFKAYLKGEKDG